VLGGNGRGDESRVDNIKSTEGGTSQSYLLKRLAPIAAKLQCWPRFGGDRRSEEAKQDQANNVSLKQHGNSAEYIETRLREQFPEIAERLERGEFKSARQAGIAAGFGGGAQNCALSLVRYFKAGHTPQ